MSHKFADWLESGAVIGRGGSVQILDYSLDNFTWEFRPTQEKQKITHGYRGHRERDTNREKITEIW